MYSMTGYGRAEYIDNGINLHIELKTVNNRNFDLNIKSPRSFAMFDDLIRKTIQTYIPRGRVDTYVTFSDKREKDSAINVDLAKAKAYLDISNKISKSLKIKNDVTTSYIMRLQDVICEEGYSDLSEFESVIKETVEKACIKLNEMRRTEGEKLISDMLSRMNSIEDLRKKILERAPLISIEYKNKLKERITESLKDVNYDEARLLNEVAFFTDKANIDEELTRLDSHIKQFKEIVKTQSCGKKLDFLMQEFNREANTICSKSNDIIVTNYALSLKNEIEKVREQVQNIE